MLYFTWLSYTVTLRVMPIFCTSNENELDSPYLQTEIFGVLSSQASRLTCNEIKHLTQLIICSKIHDAIEKEKKKWG